MLNLEFTKARWFQDDEGDWLCLHIPRGKLAVVKDFIASIKDKLHIAELKRHSPRRSLDANAYLWVLLGKLAAVLRIPPEEVYRACIRDIGGNYEIVPIREQAVEAWEQMWQAGHLGRICEDLGPCRNTPGYHNIRCYMGSSDYDTATMARLIDVVVEECKKQNIETMTPEQLERIKQDWGRKHESKDKSPANIA